MTDVLLLSETDAWEVWKLVAIGGFIVGGIVIYKIIEVVGEWMTTRETERSRRELAAYVAEGSMTPEHAERLMACGSPANWSERVAEMVREGTIDSKEAANLIQLGREGAPPPAAAGSNG